MAFTKIVGAGIHTLSNVNTHNINSSGIITATQFVGIFTGTDGDFSGDVTIDGNLTVNGTTTTLDTNLIDVDKIEVTTTGAIVGVAVTQNGSGDLVRLYDGSTQVVTVDDEGKVGVGTDSLTYPLEVWASDPRIRLVDTDLTSNRSIQLRNNEGSAILSATHHTIFYDGGEERVRIKSTGQVGIGTNNPLNLLDLYQSSGRQRFNKYGHYIAKNDNASTTNYWTFAPRSGGNLGIGRGVPDAEGTVAATNDKLHIKSTGEVGINESANINGRLHIQHDALEENILYASRYDQQSVDKPVFAVTQAQMTNMSSAGLVIGNHNMDIHLGPVFGANAGVATHLTKGIRIATGYGQIGINTNVFSQSFTALTVKNAVTADFDTVLDIVADDDKVSRLEFSETSNSGKGSIRYSYASDANFMSFHTNGTSSNDTNERLRITSTGNVGINSTSPANKLDISNGAAWIYPNENGDEAIALKLGKLEGYNTSLNDILVADDHDRVVNMINRYVAHWHFDRTTSPGATRINAFQLNSSMEGVNIGNQLIIRDLRNTADSIKLWSNGNSFVGVTTDGSTRNFGIGTNSPTAPLVVSSSANTLGILTSTDDGANLDLFDNDTQSRIRTVDGRLHLYADFDNQVADSAIRFFVDGDNEKLRIHSSGKITIGHDEISQDLHGPQTTTGRNPLVQIHGANAVSAGAALISWKNSAGAYYAPTLYLAHSGSDTKGTNGILPANGEFGSIVFSGDDGTDFVKGAMIKARLDGTPGNDDMPGRLEFYTTPDGAQVPEERLRITSTGNVGIGTNNPNPDRLRVHKDGLNQVLQRWGGRQGPTAGQRFMELYTPATDNMNDYFKFQTGNAIKFRIDNTNALCINSSGLVGIGTDTPSHELDIESSSPVIEMKDNDAGDSRFQIAQSGSQTYLDMDVGNLGSSSLRFRFAGQEKVRFTSTGRIGIGTNNPGQELDIWSTNPAIRLTDTNPFEAGAYGQIAQSGNVLQILADSGNTSSHGGVFFYSYNDNDSFNTYRISDNLHQWYISGEEKARLHSNGNLGIGTNSPGSKIEVLGNIQKKDTNGLQNFFVSDSSFKFSQSPSGWGNMDYTSTPILAWDYKSGPGDLFYIGSGGNTAIADQMAIVVSDAHGFKVGKSGYNGSDFDISSSNEFFRVSTGGKVTINCTAISAGGANPQLSVESETGSNIGIIQVHAGGGETNGDLSGIAFSHGVDGTVARPKAAIALNAIASYGKGELCFYVDNTNDNNSVSSADEKLRIKRTGGITFNGDTADANALDDYEEGSYTPTATTGGGGNITGTTSFTLRYVKIGRSVQIFGRLHFNTSASDLSSLELSLPFANDSGNKNDTSNCMHVIRGSGGIPAAGIRIFRVEGSGTTMRMQNANGQNYGDLGTTSPHINVNFSYFSA